MTAGSDVVSLTHDSIRAPCNGVGNSGSDITTAGRAGVVLCGGCCRNTLRGPGAIAFAGVFPPSRESAAEIEFFVVVSPPRALSTRAIGTRHTSSLGGREIYPGLSICCNRVSSRSSIA